MRKVLIPVEAGNPARSRAAVAEAISIYSKEPVTVHLLSVQPAVSGHVAMFFGSGELHQLQCAAGAEDLASAQAQLAAAGVPYTSSVRIGRSAETIARTARELRLRPHPHGPGQDRQSRRPDVRVAAPTSPADRQRQW